MFPSSTKREIRHCHVVVVQRRLRNVQKSVMHMKSHCFANLNLLMCCRTRCRRCRLCLHSLQDNVKMRRKILYYIHTEILAKKQISPQICTQISPSQSEERTMVFTREKMIRPIRIANDVFSRVRKMIRPIRSHRGL